MATLIFDTETTGLILPADTPLDEQPSIIELGAVLVSKGKIVEKMSQFVNPEMNLPAKITEITGITDDDLHDAPVFAEVYGEVQKLFKKADTLIAHNAQFDVGMLMLELKRLNKEDEFVWPEETLCTVQEFRHIKGRNMRMTELYEHSVGKPLEQTHRALDDVMALYEICVAKGLV